jgi:hypothetical protein
MMLKILYLKNKHRGKKGIQTKEKKKENLIAGKNKI